jgi:hypothetical protein
LGYTKKKEKKKTGSIGWWGLGVAGWEENHTAGFLFIPCYFSSLEAKTLIITRHWPRAANLTTEFLGI